jgi:hypothetical protein
MIQSDELAIPAITTDEPETPIVADSLFLIQTDELVIPTVQTDEPETLVVADSPSVIPTEALGTAAVTDPPPVPKPSHPKMCRSPAHRQRRLPVNRPCSQSTNQQSRPLSIIYQSSQSKSLQLRQ